MRGARTSDRPDRPGPPVPARPILKFPSKRVEATHVSVQSSNLRTEEVPDADWVDAAVGTLYERVMQHIPAQFERQGRTCHGCGRHLPSPADGLIRLDGQLECISCTLAFGFTSD